MSANTKIEWADHTFNPWIGCTKVGPGCGSSCATCWTNEGNTMSQEINNELELIRSILRGYKPSMARDDALYATARVKRLVGQDRAQRGEPVAWIVFAEVAGEMVPQHPSRPTLESAESDARMYIVKTEARPLYTAPQPERKPMNEDEIKDCYADSTNYDMVRPYVIAFVRAVEAFHGIKP